MVRKRDPSTFERIRTPESNPASGSVEGLPKVALVAGKGVSPESGFRRNLRAFGLGV